MMLRLPRPPRPPVLVAYASFVLIGLAAGGNGVLLLAQMSGYGVDRTTIGVTFFTSSIGFVLAGLSSGALVGRFGFRASLAIGTGTYAVACLYVASRPPFAVFVLVQLVLGYASGVLESVLNAYIVSLPDNRTMLNQLHAYFGVGALLGPLLASWVLGFAAWTVVYLVLAAICGLLVVGYLVYYPGHQRAISPGPGPGGSPGSASASGSESVLGAVLRHPGVLLGAGLLAVYVGIEIGVGNWGFSYLVQSRGLSRSLAGYAVSGYWLGLTAGRFLISPLAARFRASTARMMYACMIGIIAVAALIWLAPAAVLAVAALVLLGFLLGPIFPTTMAIVPRLAADRLGPTAIGVMNAGSVIGGSALPWLAGVITQSGGMWLLLPFAAALGVLQLAVWWPLARRISLPGN